MCRNNLQLCHPKSNKNPFGVEFVGGGGVGGLSGGGWWWCKLIFISNPTADEVDVALILDQNLYNNILTITDQILTKLYNKYQA